MVFTTEESVNYAGSWRVRYPNGSLEAFQRDKLLLSLHRSCQHRKTALSDAQGLTDTVIKKLLTQINDGIINSTVIAQTTQVALNRFDNAASVHYAAFHKN
jgi:transcriptional regulator NrdR family protein